MKNFIIPSIDLLNGNVVRLYKGDYDQKTVYNIAIDDLLLKYKNFSNLHIVDLNGAKGDSNTNNDIIINIRNKFIGNIQVGGGIRSVENVEKNLQIGINKAVLGTISINNIELTMEIIKKFGKEKIVLAIDCKYENGKWLPKANGWLENSQHDLFYILKKYYTEAKYLLVTDINVDGTMNGPNLELYKQIKEKFPNFLLQASGGVSSIQDVQQLQHISDFAIVGKALYEGMIDNI